MPPRTYPQPLLPEGPPHGENEGAISERLDERVTVDGGTGRPAVVSPVRRLAGRSPPRRSACWGRAGRGRAPARAPTASPGAIRRAAWCAARSLKQRPRAASRRRPWWRRSTHWLPASTSIATCTTEIASTYVTSAASPQQAALSRSAVCCGSSSTPRPEARFQSTASAALINRRQLQPARRREHGDASHPPAAR